MKIDMKHHKTGKVVTPHLGTNVPLFFLSFVFLGWARFLYEGRTRKALVNFLLVFTVIGSPIHGIFCSINSSALINHYISKGYGPTNELDQKSIERNLNKKVQIIN